MQIRYVVLFYATCPQIHSYNTTPLRHSPSLVSRVLILYVCCVKPSQQGNRVLGFINGTCTSHNEVTEESMETHEPQGNTLIIHSVVIHPNYLRQGLATVMLTYYLERMRENPNISRIFIIAKGNLLGFYTSVGFKVLLLT